MRILLILWIHSMDPFCGSSKASLCMTAKISFPDPRQFVYLQPSSALTTPSSIYRSCMHTHRGCHTPTPPHSIGFGDATFSFRQVPTTCRATYLSNYQQHETSLSAWRFIKPVAKGEARMYLSQAAGQYDRSARQVNTTDQHDRSTRQVNATALLAAGHTESQIHDLHAIAISTVHPPIPKVR